MLSGVNGFWLRSILNPPQRKLIPEYKEYGGETKIALMDNSSLAFMHELSQRSYPSDGILSVYDLILIPKWVMEEIEDSTYRSTYVEQLQAQGYLLKSCPVKFQQKRQQRSASGQSKRPSGAPGPGRSELCVP